MPIYEYICDKCQESFEQLVSSSKAKVSCPKCNSKKLTRQFSTFSAHDGAGSAPPCSAGSCPGAAANMGGGCAGDGCPFS